MTPPVRTRLRAAAAGVLALALGGCRLLAPPEPQKPPETPPARPAERLRPYVPATRPAEPVAESLPAKGLDARPTVPLRYAIEIWEILLPANSVTADAAFWKRVDERPGPDGSQLLRNGIRVGELPAGDLETVRKLIEDRGGTHTTYSGVNGRRVEIPLKDNVSDKTIFHFDRSADLIGRTWERCNLLWFFSFETTPRNPDRLRVALTPAVRSLERRLQYAVVPGRADREIKSVAEESNYDVTVSADLPLDRLLVIAPSPEARRPNSLGGTFLMHDGKSQKQERLILLIPHAYTYAETAGP